MPHQSRGLLVLTLARNRGSRPQRRGILRAQEKRDRRRFHWTDAARISTLGTVPLVVWTPKGTGMESVWPDHCLGAVSLTFDDGTQNQLERAVPALATRELHGTFYICPRGDDYLKTCQPWTEVWRQGHEIGNHTLSHPHPRNLLQGIRPHAGYDVMTLAEIETDILAAEKRLRTLLPNHGPRTFCYPCYTTDVGAGSTRRSYVPIVAKHFLAGRAGGEQGFFNHPYNADLHYLLATSAQQMTAVKLIALVELALARGEWCIFVFHGIDAGRLGIEAGQFQALLDHLARNRDRAWTAPVRDVADRLTKLGEAMTKHQPTRHRPTARNPGGTGTARAS